MLLARVILAVAASADSPDEARQPVTWFVHLSDIHISEEDPTRLSDLVNLGSQVLSSLRPQAIVITGDLAHSKIDNPFSGRQIESEWEVGGTNHTSFSVFYWTSAAASPCTLYDKHLPAVSAPRAMQRQLKALQRQLESRGKPS